MESFHYYYQENFYEKWLLFIILNVTKTRNSIFNCIFSFCIVFNSHWKVNINFKSSKKNSQLYKALLMMTYIYFLSSYFNIIIYNIKTDTNATSIDDIFFFLQPKFHFSVVCLWRLQNYMKNIKAFYDTINDFIWKFSA